MSMTINGIKTNVQSLLENSGYFATNGTDFAVLPHAPKENTTFIGFPAACHYYNSGQPDYATVTQNRRVYEYLVELYLQVDDTTTAADEAVQVNDLIDNIVNLFDESIDLSDSGLGLPPACDIMRPAAGELQKVETNDGTALMVTIHLFCEADITFRNS